MSFTLCGSLVFKDKIVEGTIVIKNQKIIDIQTGFSSTHPNHKHRYILPGLIEVHGHLREPGMAQKEDVPHGTRAAIAGGVTAIIDMPNTNPPTTTIKLLKEKKEKIYKDRAYTDYAFFMGVAKDSLDQLKMVNPKEIVGIKVFMAGHETTPSVVPDDETLSKIFAIAAKRNMIVAVHAEDQNLIIKYDLLYKKAGRSDPSLWSKIRPKNVVIKAVKRALALAKKYNTKIYLLHLSTAEEFERVLQARKKGLRVYGELVSYQLLFNTKSYKQYGNLIKVSPALRTPKEQDKLWKLFRKKIPDVICSEHTPHEWETKNQPNVWLAQSGMPNIQESLPAVITAWTKRFGKHTVGECLMTIARLSSYNPAKIFGFNTKGEIAVGKDADMVIIDPNKTWTVNKRYLFSKCAWSAYEGIKLKAKVQRVYLRGTKVFEDDKILVKQGFGNILLPNRQ